jgi:hypothetical protein
MLYRAPMQALRGADTVWLAHALAVRPAAARGGSTRRGKQAVRRLDPGSRSATQGTRAGAFPEARHFPGRMVLMRSTSLRTLVPRSMLSVMQDEHPMTSVRAMTIAATP